MTTALEITCPCQRGEKMTLAWCDIAQHKDLCGGCYHNEGRKRSKYQQQHDRQRAAERTNR